MRARRPAAAGGRGGKFDSATVVRSGPESVRSAAVWIVERTLASRSPTDTFLAGVADGFDERDQGLLRELVLGTLRWLRFLDHVLVAASGRRLEQVQSDLLGVLRVAIYQLLFLDRVPPHAVVSEAVDQAHRRAHRGAASFVNAVLRRIARDSSRDAWPVRAGDLASRLAVETSHPELLVRRWIERFGEDETRAILDASNRPKPLHLLAFRGKGGREILAERLIDEGIEVEPSDVSPLALLVRSGQPLRTAAWKRGELYVQDEGAQLAAITPAPRPGERVWDACAAPGGKGLAILAAEPAARLVASDVAWPRLATLAANHRRIGASSALLAASATAPPFAAAFDRVIVDYPCSGTGTLRKHPELKWRFSLAEVERLAAQALAMVEGAAHAVAPGGRLVAVSCSLEREENESMAERFLERHDDFVRASIDFGDRVPDSVREPGAGIARILPADDHDGFTVQQFERRKPRGALY